MNLLFNIYKSLGIYLFIIGLPMLFKLVSLIYQYVKRKSNPINFFEKCKLVLESVFVSIFVLGYLIFVLFLADSQLRGAFIRLSCSTIPIVAVIGILGYIAYKKHYRQIENEDVLSKHYIIQSESFLCGIFLVFCVCSIGVFIYGIVIQTDLWAIIFFLIISVVMLMAALNIGLWKIEVNDMEITYRSTFGRIRKYNFKDITKGVYKKSGAFRVYVGEKRIFTFDDNMDFRLFLEQMESLHIPIWSYTFSVKMKNKVD